MTPAQLIVNHCLETIDILPREKHAVLMRALAVEIDDPDLARDCRQLANDLERAERSQSQLRLNLSAKKSVG